jgi:transaldolase
MENNKLKQLHELGQSPWLDFIDRKILTSGDLKKLIEEDGIRGITSNPSIFEKAISSSSDYNEDIKRISPKESSNDVIFYGLAIKDIQSAADMLKKIYDESNAADGYISLEVSPHLARNTEDTIKQAMELWKSVDRKNVMIKIPATKEGLPAIRKCISEGININVTLLFGLPRYEEVIEAYISGLEDRQKANKPIEYIASVASFFISRIDVMTDPILVKKGLDVLKGKVAIAYAKMAYQIYKKKFSDYRFKKLEDTGARKQRLLWASTGSKDPSFSDIKYVDALIGPETINTLPMETLNAFRDHGSLVNTLEADIDQTKYVIDELKKNNIDIDVITQKLEEEGIEKFNTSYDTLLGAIEKQKAKINTI